MRRQRNVLTIGRGVAHPTPYPPFVRGGSPVRHLPVAIIAAALFAAAPSAQADKLLIERVNQEAGMALPARGMRMAEVERRFGPPAQRLDPRGRRSTAGPTRTSSSTSKRIA
jgi:hypothetical protein